MAKPLPREDEINKPLLSKRLEELSDEIDRGPAKTEHLREWLLELVEEMCDLAAAVEGHQDYLER